MNADKNIYLKKDYVDCLGYGQFREDNLPEQLDPIGKYAVPQKPDNLLFRVSPSSINIGFKLSIFSIKPVVLKEAYEGHRNLRKWIRNEKNELSGKRIF